MTVSQPSNAPEGETRADAWAHARWAVPGARLVRHTRTATPADRAELFRTSLASGDAAASAGVDPNRTALQLWRDKTGRSEQRTPAQRARTANAVAMAPVVVDLFARAEGVAIRRVGLLTSREHPWQLARVDALTGDGGILEATTSSAVRHIDEWVDPVTGAHTVPAQAHARALHDLAVTGRSHAWIACLMADTKELIVRRVERDQDAIDALVDTERAFWEGNVRADAAPAPVPADNELMGRVHPVASSAFSRELDRAVELRARREKLKAEIAELEEQVALIDQQAKAEAGDAATVTTDGKTVYTWAQTGRFDAEAFAEAHPLLAAQYTRQVDQLDWRAVCAAHPEAIAFRGRVVSWKASPEARQAAAAKKLLRAGGKAA